MKKFVTLIAAAFAFNAAAQSSIQLTHVESSKVLSPNSTIYTVTVEEDIAVVTIDIKNISSTSQSYGVIRYDKMLNSSPTATAQAYFCVAGTCYPADTRISVAALNLNAGESSSAINGDFQMLVTDLFEIETKGESVVKYTVYNRSNPNDSVQITIQYNGTVTGIRKANSESHFRLYPNPATNGIVTLETAAANSEVEIINLLGMTVKKEKTGNGSTSINVADLPAGTYFVKVPGDKDTRTERLIITK